MQRIPSQYSYSPKSKLNGPTSRLTRPLRVVIPELPVGISVSEWWPVSAEVDWIAALYIDNKPNPSALVDEKALYYAVADRRIAGTAIDTRYEYPVICGVGGTLRKAQALRSPRHSAMKAGQPWV
ncbi:uncharacterized protein METZ01_LOCUS354870, partial [marine metagenome]